jgi:4-hydroxy-tetrahydrodipicolinate reductase
MSIRVVQWATGWVGARALLGILAHPELELVGVYAHSADKVGRDAGQLAGLVDEPPTGVTATGDIGALLALEPDAVCFTPKHFDVDVAERLLGAGLNVATTAELITGSALAASDRARLEAAAASGRSTLFGTGMNPGFLQVLGLVATGLCQRVDRVVVTESVDASMYDVADTWIGHGFTRPADDPGIADLAKEASTVVGEGVEAMALALGLTGYRLDADIEVAAATEDLDLGWIQIPNGTVGGMKSTWFAEVEGRRVIESRQVWRMGMRGLAPDWPVEHGYVVEVHGVPGVHLKMIPFPAPEDPDVLSVGQLISAMPCVNAIPAVVAAAPGLVTARDLPLITARMTH